jgi:hypothetical protein
LSNVVFKSTHVDERFKRDWATALTPFDKNPHHRSRFSSDNRKGVLGFSVFLKYQQPHPAKGYGGMRLRAAEEFRGL